MRLVMFLMGLQSLIKVILRCDSDICRTKTDSWHKDHQPLNDANPNLAAPHGPQSVASEFAAAHLDKRERETSPTTEMTHSYIFWRHLKRQRHKVQSEGEYLRLRIQIQSHAGAGLCLWWSGLWWNLWAWAWGWVSNSNQMQMKMLYYIPWDDKVCKDTLQSQPRRTTHLWYHLHVDVGDSDKETDFRMVINFTTSWAWTKDKSVPEDFLSWSVLSGGIEHRNTEDHPCTCSGILWWGSLDLAAVAVWVRWDGSTTSCEDAKARIVLSKN